jgi:hypothetical protein
MKPNAESAVPSTPRSTGRHRKSKPRRADWAAGDGAKFLSYAEAWTRIREARRKGFFLEAVTLQESILSDRLTSFLVKSCGLDPGSKSIRSFNDLIGVWAREATIRLSDDPERVKEVADFKQHLDAWRVRRNEIVHGLVKSKAQKGSDHIDNFLDGAHAAAEEGEELARSVDRWVNATRKILALATAGKSDAAAEQ